MNKWQIIIKSILSVAVAITCISLLTISSAAEKQASRFLADYTQTLYNDDSGMFSAEVNDVYQTENGYMWFATYGGLIRYDGNDFSHVTETSAGALPNISAMALCEDDDGSLWVATNGNGVLVLSPTYNYKFITKADGLPSISVRSLAKDNNGNIYVGTTNGICKINSEGKITSYPSTNNLFIRDISISENGTVYAVADNGYLISLTENDDIIVKGYDYDFSCVRIENNSKIQLGTDNGKILEFSFSENFVSNISVIEAHTSNVINDIYKDSYGRIWIVSESTLSLLSDDGTVENIENLGIPSNFSSIIQDYDGNYWIASDKYGVLKAIKSRFCDFNFEYNLPETVVNAIVKNNGDFYIGTDNGLIVLSDGELVSNKYIDRLQGERIRSIYKDSKGNILIATYNSNMGLVTLSPNGEIHLFKDLPNDKIRNINELADGSLLIGTADGAYIVKDNKLIKHFNKNDGLINTVILCTCQDKDGTIYIGSDGGGIYTVKDDKIGTIDESSGLDGEVILRMVYDEERDVVWVSTGNTIMYIKDGEVHKADTAGIYSNIFDFIIKDNGYIWMTSANEIYYADADDLMNYDGKLALKSIPRTYGLSSSVCSNSWNYMDEKGTLYLCCIKGINSIDTNMENDTDYIPQIILSSVVTDNEELFGTDTVPIPRNNQRLTINLSVMNYVPSDGVTVEYYLEGQDVNHNIVNSNNLKTISYTNLSGGDYSFHLNVLDDDGNVISSNILFTLNVDYAFYERPLVILSIIIVALFILLSVINLIFRRREKNIIKRQEELKKILNQAISAITNTIDAKDRYTSGHSMRVAKYSLMIGKNLKLDQDTLEDLYYTAILHDVGKIGIPDSVLNKPGKLTDEEFAIMKQHPAIGGEILSNITAIKDISLGAKQHHERWDGHGYTQGLAGEEICLTARIICVADSFDAMATNRAYRKHLEKEKILDELTNCSGKQFDPKIAVVMIEMINNGDLDDVFITPSQPINADTASSTVKQ